MNAGHVEKKIKAVTDLERDKSVVTDELKLLHKSIDNSLNS